MASGRRGRAVRVAVPRLYRRHYFVIIKTEGLKAPGYSYPRLSDVFSLTTHYSLLIAHYHVILNLFNFVQFAHARHSSSKFGSALAKSQISGSVRGEELERLAVRC